MDIYIHVRLFLSTVIYTFSQSAMAMSSLYLPEVTFPSVGDDEEPISLVSLVPPPVGDPPQGFPVCVLVILSDRYLCGLCELVLKEPVQSPCGHRYVLYVTLKALCYRLSYKYCLP